MNTTKIRDEIYAQIDESYLTVYNTQRELMKLIAKRELSRKSDPTRKSELTNYEFRLEMSGVGFVCRWLNIKFYNNNGKTVRVVKSVAIPRSGKYEPQHFRFAEEWELELILQVEEVISLIRKYVRNLTKAHTSLICANKAIGIEFKTIDIKYRLDLPKLSIAEIKKGMA
ncbi:conjugative transfer protein MobI(A/C) [Vibrio pelagius]|uniref:conjugative transfer protein MobI(A/C) n=1 Tax=Vibrio pelagius TaxID=28169 RepID=UPI00354F4D36